MQSDGTVRDAKWERVSLICVTQGIFVFDHTVFVFDRIVVFDKVFVFVWFLGLRPSFSILPVTQLRNQYDNVASLVAFFR